MTKILITGGAGFIGSHLVEKLLDKKNKVLIVDNLKTIGGLVYINPRASFLNGDITEKKTINKIEKWKPKIIYHLAAQSGGESAYDNPKNDYMSNGYGTYLLAILAKKIKVKQFIYTSSVAVYGSNPKTLIRENSAINPDSIYGISKYVGEMFIKQILYSTKIKTTILRVFNTFGPGENLNYLKKGMLSIYASYVWRKKPVVVKGSLKRFRNFNYIDDVIYVLINTLNNKNLKKNEIVNLTSGTQTTVKKALNLIFDIKKKKYKIYLKKGTPGDSFGYHASNSYLKKKYKKYKATVLKNGLKKYFRWIDLLPQSNNLKKYHPLNIKKD